MKRWVPWIAVAVFGGWMLAGMLPKSPEAGFHLKEFGRLPVLLNGRIQPLDSVARNSLLTMRGKQTVAKEKGGKYITALEWMLEVALRPEEGDQYKSFRVQHPEVQELLGVRSSGIEYLSFNDIAPHLDKLEKQVMPIIQAERQKTASVENRSPFQKDLIHLYESLILYRKLKNSLQPEDSSEFVAQYLKSKGKEARSGAFLDELNLYKDTVRVGVAAVQASEKGETHNQAEVQGLVEFFRRYQDLDHWAYPLIVPPANPAETRDDWRNIGRSLLESMKSGEISPAVAYYATMTKAYTEFRSADFNQALTSYRQWLSDRRLLPELDKGQREAFFNQAEPFYKAMVIYVAALLLGCAYWLRLSEWVRRAGFSLLILAFVIHTFGLGFRMHLEGRPPVTNLYSSAIFVGWGAVLLGMILERIFRDGIGTVASAGVGFTTLIIAHHLALGGDTMEMLRAVLDTNFWLATHVVMITTGYASMFFAGFLAILYVARGFFTQTLSPSVATALSRMVYGIVCFSTLFSFVGTILGGIWADQSWGRFWGWDPKENGALLIVIWCAIILHARWGRMINERGLMALAIFGNIVTSFSWFGVNMLNTGLHSYGFMDKAFKWLMIFVASQVVLIALTLLPDRYWRSFRGRAPTPKKPLVPQGSIDSEGPASPVHA